jgi:hypothetical protein
MRQGTSDLGLLLAVLTVVWGYIWTVVALCVRMELLDRRASLTEEAQGSGPATFTPLVQDRTPFTSS